MSDDRNFALEYRQEKQRKDQAEELAREMEQRTSTTATPLQDRDKLARELLAAECGDALKLSLLRNSDLLNTRSSMVSVDTALRAILTALATPREERAEPKCGLCGHDAAAHLVNGQCPAPAHPREEIGEAASLLREQHEAMADVMMLRRLSSSPEQRAKAESAIAVWQKVKAFLASPSSPPEDANARWEGWPEDAPDISEGLALATALEAEANRSDDARKETVLNRQAALVRRLTATLKLAYLGPLASSLNRVSIADESLCPGDQRPCFVGRGTDDAHFRCGTVQCGRTALSSTPTPIDGEGTDNAG